MNVICRLIFLVCKWCLYGLQDILCQFSVTVLLGEWTRPKSKWLMLEGGGFWIFSQFWLKMFPTITATWLLPLLCNTIYGMFSYKEVPSPPPPLLVHGTVSVILMNCFILTLSSVEHKIGRKCYHRADNTRKCILSLSLIKCYVRSVPLLLTLSFCLFVNTLICNHLA